MKERAYIVGGYEHPLRFAPGKSVVQLHAECAVGALSDAGLSLRDVDAYFCAADAPGASPAFMADYLNLDLRHFDGTHAGGCSYIVHVGHAVQAIASGRCNVALITMAGKPRSSGMATGTAPILPDPELPPAPFEAPYQSTVVGVYGAFAKRHMYEFGTTSEQMAWVRVAAAAHAQHNPNALFRTPCTVDDVLASPMIADPLRRLDCCVITDGGGALVIANQAIARSLPQPLVRVRGYAQTVKTNAGGYLDLLTTGAVRSGPEAFADAGVAPGDIKYVSIYDNFTISVIMQLEDLGFCKKGEGGRFVADGNLIAGIGKLPFNTDGGGLCNNHPANRGGMTKLLEAMRQVRGQAAPAVQVPGCDLALACGPGALLNTGHSHATVILERE
ncbi:MAG: thiolase domain-containing protein [Pseudomonadota bacterium]